jgi:phosphatidylserine/phosphatidylglycerophosphate/cardiolipin synthase-like enzyme
MSRSLIVLPDDSARPLLDAIGAATSSLCVKMFLITEAALIAAVSAARSRGVRVRVLLNPARRAGGALNLFAREALVNAGVDVRDGNPAFAVTHEKSMVVDGRVAYVKSLNWSADAFTRARDYAVRTNDEAEVAEIMECFEADWGHRTFDAGADTRLVWCPGNGRERLARIIDEARHSLWVQNERYQDAVIVERLVRAHLRGVKVRVMAPPTHTLKPRQLGEGVGGLRIMADVGIPIHTLHRLKLHAKVMVADGRRGVVGSINLTPGSFDTRRDLAIEVRGGDVVARLHTVVRRDWKQSRRLDLTDDGILADLADHRRAGAERLALEHARRRRPA